jgi:hypothetical protein
MGQRGLVLLSLSVAIVVLVAAASSSASGGSSSSSTPTHRGNVRTAGGRRRVRPAKLRRVAQRIRRLVAPIVQGPDVAVVRRSRFRELEAKLDEVNGNRTSPVSIWPHDVPRTAARPAWLV